MNRRAHFLTTVFLLAAAFAIPEAKAETADTRPAKQRRMIFDNDGNDARDAKTLSPEDVLAIRTAGLAGTQVDTIFFCTNGGFGESRRPSKAWPHAQPGSEKNPYRELERNGTDVLKLMVEFGHKHKMEVFSNVRMNDVHDGAPSLPDADRFVNNAFKAAHPELLMNKKVYRKPRTGSWTAVNYARAEVRDAMFAYLEEACRNYDIDGLHLDFFRHSCFFRSTFLGKPCTDEERAAMTDLLRRTRTMMKDAGEKRRRPLLLSIRVPDSPAYCRDIGLDIEHWLKEGWVDLLTVTSYFQLSDWADSVALGKKYGVPVYPSLDEARSKDAGVLAQRTSLLSYRGRAAAAWGAGVDGIMMFNWTDPASPHWRELGDPKALGTMEKDYFASVRGPGAVNGGHLPYPAYVKGELLHPDNPRALEPATPATAKIRLGAMNPEGAKCTLRLRFRPPADPASLSAELDNKPVTPLRAEGDWLEADLPVTAFGFAAPALHEVKVSLREGSGAVSWLDLMVTERRPK